MASDSSYLNSPERNSSRFFSYSVMRNNIREMRFSLIEFSGSLGDLGTFIPLTVAMSVVNGVDIASVLFFAGLFNILTGVLFGLPIPVQPMKAIAAVAIAEALLPGEIVAAGICTGAFMLILGMTGLTERIDTFVPKSVVRGIQLGVGLKLFIKGVSFIIESSLWGLDSVFGAVVMIGIVIVTSRMKRFPTALLLLFIGFAIVLVQSASTFSKMGIEILSLQIVVPSGAEWIQGVLYGTLPQIPLTLLNSVIAVCALSGDLFPGRRISTDRMATSVGIMNLIGCWFGAIPMCHGSGGLAGQYRFGARTGGSVVMLGVGKMLVGLFFGGSAIWLLTEYPMSVLGVMLLFAGIELARPATDQKKMEQIVVLVVTAIGILAVNTLVGFIAGLFVYSVVVLILKSPQK